MKSATRMVLAAWLAACVSVVWPQDLGQRVTFSSPAKRLEVLADELSQKTGVRIQVGREIAREVVAVQVRDVPLLELLRRIAAVTQGELTRDAQGHVELDLDRQKVRREQQEELAQRTENFRRLLRSYENMLAQDEGRAPRWPGSQPLSPESRARARLLLLIGPEELAEVRPWERRVFSNLPTRAQRRLGPQAEPIMEELVASRRAMRLERVAEPGTEVSAWLRRTQADARRIGLIAPEHPLTEPATTVLLIVTLGDQMGHRGSEEISRMKLRLYDRAGNMMLDHEVTGRMQPAVFLEEDPPNGEGTAQARQAPVPIQFSAIAQELSTLFTGLEGDQPLRPSPALLHALRRPDLVDPHALVASEASMALAANKGLPFVGNFPDTFLPMFAGLSGASPQFTTASWERELLTSDDVSLTTEGGWMVIQPRSLSEARANRVDRIALANLIRAAEEKYAPGLEDWSAYIAASPFPGRPNVEIPYLMFWMGMPNPPDADWLVKRLYGLLSASQRRILETGRQLPFRTFTRPQREVLQMLLFGPDTELDLPVTDAFLLRYRLHLPFFFHPSLVPGKRHISQEPTVAMPNGIPADGHLRMEVERMPILYPTTRDGTLLRHARPRDPLEHANMLVLRVRPEVIQHVKVGQRRVLRFTFLTVPGAELQVTLHDDTLPRDARLTTVDNLPSDFAEAMRNHLGILERLRGQFGSPGDLTPPGELRP